MHNYVWPRIYDAIFVHIKYEAISKFTGYNDTKNIGVLNERTSRQQNFSNKTHRRLKLKIKTEGVST